MFEAMKNGSALSEKSYLYQTTTKSSKKNGRFTIEDWLLTCDEANKINATF